jgi:hypothetical protein
VPNCRAVSEVPDNNGARFSRLLGTMLAKMLWQRQTTHVRLAPWTINMCMAMTLVTLIKMKRNLKRQLDAAAAADTRPSTLDAEEHHRHQLAILLEDISCSDQLVAAALDNQLLASTASFSTQNVWGVGYSMLAARTVRSFVARRRKAAVNFGDVYLHEPYKSATELRQNGHCYSATLQDVMRGYCLNIEAAKTLAKLIGPRDAFRVLGLSERRKTSELSCRELLIKYIRPESTTTYKRYRECLERQLQWHNKFLTHVIATANDSSAIYSAKGLASTAAFCKQAEVLKARQFDVLDAENAVHIKDTYDAVGNETFDQKNTDGAVPLCELCFFIRYMLRRSDADPKHVARFVRATTSTVDVRDQSGHAAANAGDSNNTIFIDFSTKLPAWPTISTCSRTLNMPTQGDDCCCESNATARLNYVSFCRRMDLLLNETRIFNL